MLKCLNLRKRITARSRDATQNTEDRITRQLNLFISSLILQFIRKLILYDRIVTGDMEAEIGGNFDQYQHFISDFAKPLTSLLGSEISVPINLGLTITTFAARKLRKKFNKEKARKIISILPLDDSSTTLFVALLACDICRMFEHQVVLATQDTASINLRLLAKVTAKRVLNHMAKSNLLNDNSVVSIVDKNSMSYNQLEDLARICVSGVRDGISKHSSERLFDKSRDKSIACGDLLTQLGLIDGAVGEKGTGVYFPDQKHYVKQWGYRRPSLISDYELKPLIENGQLPSDDKLRDKGYKVVPFDTAVWEHFSYSSHLSAVNNFESLKEYATSALKKTLTDEDEHFTAETLKDLKIKVENLPKKEDLHREIDGVMATLNQMITKEGVEEIVNKLEKGCFSKIDDAIGILKKVESNMDKLRSDFNEFTSVFRSKSDAEISEKGTLRSFGHQENKFNSEYDLVEILQHVPNVAKTEHAVVRKEFEKNLLEALQNVHKCSGHVLVHGIGGCGNINEDGLLKTMHELMRDLDIAVSDEIGKTLSDLCKFLGGAINGNCNK
ncbi:uncharacterized protein TRIADDRAFT_62114 [Trichoplax adhaerens]|uniref:Uncharacterized protein n=1 Tax=Trichoplax adhaerens TaxID=10228 RepID=B3SCW0_TRIAD|nr:predicted protein [Trichoplax adhaerens]EDV19412.1 predicted protein [Trichoplax adhaerens]|eukprot:XP_002118101.1 predicted protein [Trichoplax adhaerens]